IQMAINFQDMIYDCTNVKKLKRMMREFRKFPWAQREEGQRTYESDSDDEDENDEGEEVEETVPGKEVAPPSPTTRFPPSALQSPPHTAVNAEIIDFSLPDAILGEVGKGKTTEVVDSPPLVV
ncbi:hypothetical protein PMAYCL1PPCAC_25463, partial [Pristionchus mayeri]